MIEAHEIKPDDIKLRAEKVSLDALKKVLEDNKWCWEIFCDVIDEKHKKKTGHQSPVNDSNSFM